MKITSPKFNEREIEELRKCLDSGWVTQGPMTKAFEIAVANRHNVAYALATTSCTAALHLSALALDLKPGDEVIVPAFTWVTSAHCAEYVGANAVFADIELTTFNLDPRKFEAAITPRTKAVVAVHLFGGAARMGEIMATAARHRLRVIEDAACAIGTMYGGKPVGGLGDCGCFSFHPRKIITTGEGGMVTTNDATIADRINSLRNHGTSGEAGPQPVPPRPYVMGQFNRLGFNLRLSDIQSSVGVAQMEKLDALLAERRAVAERYDALLEGIDEVQRPAAVPGSVHTFQAYVILVREGGVTRRNAIMDYLAEKNIQTRPGTHAIHRLGYYREKYGLHADDFPNASAAEDLSITLPIFPGMTAAQQEFVVGALSTALMRSVSV
jgi:dTDP-4-amino-4,6-dideoxygalactose transaminase